MARPLTIQPGTRHKGQEKWTHLHLLTCTSCLSTPPRNELLLCARPRGGTRGRAVAMADRLGSRSLCVHREPHRMLSRQGSSVWPSIERRAWPSLHTAQKAKQGDSAPRSMVRRGFTIMDRDPKNPHAWNALRGLLRQGRTHLCQDLIYKQTWLVHTDGCPPIQTMPSGPRPLPRSQLPRDPSPAQPSPVLPVLQPWLCLTPSLTPSGMPTLPTFVRISKSVLPTPKTPSIIMGSFSKLSDGAPHHAIPPGLRASRQAP